MRRAALLVLGLGVLTGCPSSASTKKTAPKVSTPPMILPPILQDDGVRIAPIEVAPIDPQAKIFLTAHVSEPTALLAPGSLPPVTLLALEATARGEAKGMDPVGEPLGAKLALGGRARFPLPMERGDCVTVIAHGGLGVMEIDAFIVTVPNPETPSDFQVLAEDTRTGPLALVGGQRGCYLSNDARGEHAEVWVQARKGAGPVVVGIYRAQGPK